jgi:nucleoside phosphorylase
MKLGIIGAMDMEVEILVAALENKKEQAIAGSKF